MFEIMPIPALQDNYIWCIVHLPTRRCAIVDPGTAAPVQTFLTAQQLELKAILLTHHHWDHTQGVVELTRTQPVPVYGPANAKIAGLTTPLQAGMTVTLFEAIAFQVLAIPGHTLDHLGYYSAPYLFCGDTLFSAGCGRLFEGTAEQMHASLTQLSQLPAATQIYCGHEYTLANLQFAQTVEPHNPAIAAYQLTVTQRRQTDLPSLPSTLALEKTINPFLRSHISSVIETVSHYAQQPLTTALDVFRYTRQWKDNFKS